MAYKDLFVDSDVLLDMLLERHPYYVHSQLLLTESKQHNLKLNTSSLIIANINYFLSKKIGTTLAKGIIRELIKLVKVLPFESDIINMALDSNFSDFEDAIQFHISKRFGCDAILTRNIKDYKHADIPVLTAEQFLNTL